MELGAFSISLTVKDLQVSYEFYRKLGFTKLGGDIEYNYLILKNGDAVIGLFQGMFEKNILTFNPGWNTNAEEVNPFTDVRQIEQELQSKGIQLIETTTTTEGIGHITLVDPDGNPILIDQHR
ncbi:VOC family protein [Candidatus Xianfuyuplasma coldseepsis]|uniref:VOC family protein n=1 Tax=Candidatus Xianfuyuplasma coldseepsis TaxID=2782163 RepID=A0A7L7KSQ6_9MOLU|nr:VOC family protein [Xianfuyuplasma coldseepsis]QMS85302.1 VOC family protein [Xianfuyuplasma coldseepsis]